MAGAPGPETYLWLASAQLKVKHAGCYCRPNAIAATKAVADDLRCCLDDPGHWRREVYDESQNCVCGLISVRFTDAYTHFLQLGQREREQYNFWRCVSGPDLEGNLYRCVVESDRLLNAPVRIQQCAQRAPRGCAAVVTSAAAALIIPTLACVLARMSP